MAGNASATKLLIKLHCCLVLSSICINMNDMPTKLPTTVRTLLGAVPVRKPAKNNTQSLKASGRLPVKLLTTVYGVSHVRDFLPRSIETAEVILGISNRLTSVSGMALKDIHPERLCDATPHLLMARFFVKTAKFSEQQQKRSKIRVIDWEIKKTSRGIKYIPVDVTATTSRRTTRKDAQKMNDDKAALHEAAKEAAPLSMDVDENIWMEEPVSPRKKRVCLTRMFFLSGI
jgi:hypothetical protein